MIVSFASRGTEDVYNGLTTGAARKACPRSLWPDARRKLDRVNRVVSLSDLRVPPGNRLERLRGDRAGFFSIRINEQFRICFRWENGHAWDVEITDYH